MGFYRNDSWLLPLQLIDWNLVPPYGAFINQFRNMTTSSNGFWILTYDFQWGGWKRSVSLYIFNVTQRHIIFNSMLICLALIIYLHNHIFPMWIPVFFAEYVHKGHVLYMGKPVGSIWKTRARLLLGIFRPCVWYIDHLIHLCERAWEFSMSCLLNHVNEKLRVYIYPYALHHAG